MIRLRYNPAGPTWVVLLFMAVIIAAVLGKLIWISKHEPAHPVPTVEQQDSVEMICIKALYPVIGLERAYFRCTTPH